MNFSGIDYRKIEVLMEVKIDRYEIWPAFTPQRYPESEGEPSAGTITMSEQEIEDWKRAEDEWDKWQSIIIERLQRSGGNWA